MSASEDKIPARLGTPLQARHVAMIALGGVVGAGLFVGSSAAILAAGPAVILSYALAGTMAFLVMRMLGEMAVARPGLGSFHAYIGAALGTRASFISGWLYWYFWIIAVGAETIAGASLMHEWVALPVWLLGLVLITSLTATNLLSVRAYGEFEYWFSLLKVLAIVGFILVAGAWLGAQIVGGSVTVASLSDQGGLMPHGVSGVLGAVPVVIFSLCGSEIASIAAAESGRPAENVARAARSVALRIMVFYILAVALIVCVVPWSTLVAGQSPFVAAMARIGIPGAATIMQAIILVAVLSCLNSGLYVTSRTLFELADAGHAPHVLVATDENRVPTRAILLGAAAGFAAALASILSPGLVFAFLLNTSGSVILFIYVIIALAEIRLRRDLEMHQNLDADAEPPAFAVWWFPWLSYAVILAIGIVFVTMAILPSQRLQILAGGASVLVAAGASRFANAAGRASAPPEP